MKKILSLLSILICINVFSQITFQKTFGGSNHEQGWEVIQLPDSSYVVAGSTRSFGDTDGDFYLIKTNKYGDLLWEKTYGGMETDFCWSFDKTFDGGFILAGITDSFGLEEVGYYLVKVDSSGNLMWQKQIPDSNMYYLKDVFQSFDSCYYFLGILSGDGDLDNDIQVLKTDAMGNTIWQKTYGGEFNDIPNCFIQSSDTNILITGGMPTLNEGNHDVFLMSIDTSGNLVWTNTYGGMYGDIAQYLIKTYDNGYMISGYTRSSTSDSLNKLYLIKLNNFYDTVWTKSYNNHFFVNGRGLAQTSDSGYIVTGSEKITGNYYSRLYLLKIDKNGNEEWTVTHGEIGINYGLCVLPTFDEGYIVSGTNSSVGAGGEDVFLLKTDKSGLSTGLSQYKFKQDVEIFPNPTTSRIRIKAKNIVGIELLDLQGMVIYKLETQCDSQEVDLHKLTKGIYLVKVITANGFSIEKIIKD